MNTQIRPATAADLDTINAIYNHYVRTSTCTYEETPWTPEQRRAWWTERDGRYAVLVVEFPAAPPAQASRVVGWASLSLFRPAPGYRFTVRNSIYLAPDCCGQGLGRQLLTALLAPQHTADYHSVIAGISADQTPSRRLHAALGFAKVAILRAVGFKFGRWLDVVYMQRMF